MSVPDFIFLLLGFVVILGAFLAVTLRNVFHNALGMGLSFFGLAGVYVYLNAEFVAVLQILIYIGAIAIAIIFAIMLSQPMWKPQPKSSPGRQILAAVTGCLFFMVTSKILLQTKWPEALANPVSNPLHRMGELLLTVYLVPFEIVSVILLIVVIGSIHIAGQREAS